MLPKVVAAASCLTASLALVSCGVNHMSGNSPAHQGFIGPVTAKYPHVPTLQNSALLSAVSYSTVAAVLNGRLEITTDAGLNWKSATLPAQTFPVSLDFVSSTTGWVLASSSTRVERPVLYKTTDGGRIWHNELEGSAKESGGALDMLSSQVGWLTIGSTLYRTTTGGRQWHVVNLPAGSIPGQIDFVSATQGWITASRQSGSTQSSILATHDGIHFHPILSTSHSVGPIDLQPDGQGYALESNPSQGPQFGSLVTTRNAGRSWSTLTSAHQLGKSGAYGYVGGMAFGGKTGWIGTTNGAQGFQPSGILITANGGTTWHTVGGHRGWAIQDVAMTNPGRGWILARGPLGLNFLARTYDNGKHWTVLAPPTSPNSLDFNSPRVGYGLGIANNAAAVVKTEDAGRHWVPINLPPHVFSAYGFSQHIGLGAYDTYTGNQATPVTNLYRFTAGTNRWHLVSKLTGVNGLSLDYLGKRSWVMAVQLNGSFNNSLEWSVDNGVHWKKLGLVTTPGTLANVVNPQGAWVFSSPAKTSATGEGTLSWNSLSGTTHKTVLRLPAAGPVQYLVNRIDFLNAQVGWVFVTKNVMSHTMIRKPGSKTKVRAAPYSSQILYDTTDGGRQWTEWKLPESWNITAANLVTSRIGYLSVNGAVVDTQDGGAVWHLSTP